MSTALVMDFYSNVVEQALKEANEADAGVGGTAGILINRRGTDPVRSDSTTTTAPARRENTCAPSSRK